ncbi:SgcJ/EcaC family oxidoreductase [Micromonospora mangrovi]|uniref:SgcJ/EcaC family oxidoreductase n=2 Tax=Micromonospora TaxID=1873 RepID=A0AAU8HC68_9ACTN
MTTSSSVQSPISGQDQAAVAAVPARMIETWAAHDADGFADLFVEDGTMILPGLYRKGRDEIRAFMAAAFAGHYQGTRVTGTPLEIKPLSGDAVALITEGGVIRAGADELADSDAIRASWILVRRGDGWKLAVYQNGPRDPK